jgi:hypothetical protein
MVLLFLVRGLNWGSMPVHRLLHLGPRIRLLQILLPVPHLSLFLWGAVVVVVVEQLHAVIAAAADQLVMVLFG